MPLIQCRLLPKKYGEMGKESKNPAQQHFEISQRFFFYRGAKIRDVCINNNSGDLRNHLQD